ncbi:MAG TPA: VWA domain-containing protein [Candidatus Elarobacter sp.]
MNSTLIGFVQAARAAGIRVSVAESLDAFRTAEAIGYADRGTLKDALSIVMAKSHGEKQLFGQCFDSYFARTELAGAARGIAADSDPERDVPPGAAPLTRMLLAGDRAGLALAMERAANRAGTSTIRYWTQTAMFARRLLDELGFAELARDIERLRGDADALAEELLDRARDDLRADARAFVERQLSVSGRRWDDDALGRMTLWNLDSRDVDRMRVLVRAMAKRLATRYGRDRRSARRGRLDVRRTMRRNTGHDGVPFITVHKRKKIDKPRVVALCDVSGSVAPFAQFLLLFLHSLRDALSDVRAFAFSNRLIEVDDILDKATVDEAIAEVMRRIGLGSSDYGRSLEDFAAGWLDHVDRHTSVIIMGDARTNYADPRPDIVKTLADRAKRVIWLNPESRSSWGTGDSAMLRYLPHCNVARHCATLRDLERAMSALLVR